MLLRKNDSGRSIVEMLGVLAIMGVITVMGISGYSQAIGKINRNNVVEAVTKIAQETRGMFAASDDYNTSYDGGIQGLFKKMKYKLDTPYGGTYDVQSNGNGAGANPGFYVMIPGVPLDDCLYFTTMKWMDTMDKDYASISSEAYTSATTDDQDCQDEGTTDIYVRYR